ncbi:MAG TPA: dihydrolipoamide acetyltransferase family protein [Actinomycetota bacterium]|nr:dihydrolipoamide acetyltransferase family protein [Actinomycetota bacterium]
MTERVFDLPDLGEGLEEGTISVWLVAEGDAVELNQPIAEIETAKAVVEMPSPFAGRIVRLHVAAGEEARVGSPLVTFEVASDARGSDPAGAPASASTRASAPLVTAPMAPEGTGGGGVAATPAVRRLAKDLSVDLATIDGTGAGGRITRDDVEASAAANAGPTEEAERAVPHSPARRAIAARLAEVAAIPQVTTFRTLDCTDLDAFRRSLGVSPLPVLVAALGRIRPDHDLINASWGDDAIRVHEQMNVGVATDTGRGLMVPVVRDAGSRGIAALGEEITRLADAARAGTIALEDMTGATIAVSNTGSYGSEAGTPLLNPGHAVTLAFGMIAPRALVVDGAVEARLACTISLTFDHRVLDGATIGRALTALIDVLGSREQLETLPR